MSRDRLGAERLSVEDRRDGLRVRSGSGKGCARTRSSCVRARPASSIFISMNSADCQV